MEKWSLLHDMEGARYDIMTTNHAKVYNWVIRGLRSQPLVAIVEGVLHDTVGYFRERHANAALHAANPHTPYCLKITAYMQAETEKAQSHTVFVMGNTEHRFNVVLRDKAGFGTARSLVTHKVCLGDHVNEHSCTCNKLKLIHKPCSHVLATCGTIHMDPLNFISEYFMKERVQQAWCDELRGFRVVGNFATLDIAQRTWILDLDLLKGGRVTDRVVVLGTIWTNGKLEQRVDIAAAAARKATLRELARCLPTHRNTDLYFGML